MQLESLSLRPSISAIMCGVMLMLVLTAPASSSSTRRVYVANQKNVPLDQLLTVSLRDYGAAGDGVTDDGPALQSALDAIAQAGGGTVYVPAGTYAIGTPVVKQFLPSADVVIQGEPSSTPIDVRGNGAGLQLTSEFVIRVGEANDAISISGAESVRFSDITFIGVPTVLTDAHIVLKLTDISDARIVHCEFYGLASLVYGGAIVLAFHSALSVEQTAFLGCATTSGLNTSVVQNVRWKAISLIDSKFIDYGLRPDFYSKTPLAPAYSWLSIGNAASLDASDSRREAIVQNVFMDEGNYFGISAIPELYDNVPTAPFEVYLSRVNMNVTNLASVGVYLTQAQKVFIDRSHFGWSHNAGAAIYLSGVHEAIFDQLECVDHADNLVADSTTQRLTVINSIYLSLFSQAESTVAFTTADRMDDPVEYVRQQYLSLVGHEPDPVGLYYWADLMLLCQNDSACINEKKMKLAHYLERIPSARFSIEGTVRDENGLQLSGATVSLTGSQSVSTISDGSGHFSFQKVATAGNYVVTASKRHYVFQSLIFDTPTRDQSGDLGGVLNRHNITGRVITQNGQPIVDALISLSDPQHQTTTTDAGGNYAFSDVPAGNDYTLTVTHPNYTFPAGSFTVSDLSQDEVVNFEGSLLSYEITGGILSNTGSAIAGTSVTLSGSSRGIRVK